jgi:peptide/nickel transport system substrate-binding protein
MDEHHLSDRAGPGFLGQPLTRRRLLKGLVAVTAASAVLPLAAACAPQQAPSPKPVTEPAKPGAGPAKPAEAAKAAAGEPKMGGTLKVAILGEPPALDSMFTTATVAADTSWHVMETLFSRNMKQEPVPHLLEKYDASADGKNVSLLLRKGVPFHNDKEMTSADVLASLKRFADISPRGKSVLDRAESIEAKDKYTITIAFKEATAGILPIFLANRDCPIFPEEQCAQFGKEKIPQPIGTGPYKFVEHLPDRHVRFARFDKYAALETAADGPSGKRVAYFDEILFIPVPEESVRADGVGTGEYDYADTLAPDTFDKVKALPNVTPDIGKPYYWATPHFNKKEGMFTNVKLRQAVMYAVDIDPIAKSAFGNPDFYRIGPDIAAPETAWYTDVGKEVYDKPDPEKAKALMREAGYDDSPVRWMSTKEYFYNYNGSLPFKQALEAVGFKVDLQLMDWATLVKRRADSKEYDVFVTAHSSYVHPIQQPYLAPTWPGWWTHPEKDKLVSAIMAETDAQKQMEHIKQLQILQYQDVPLYKYGEYFVLRARSNKIKGNVNYPEPFFWNAWFG